MLEKVKAGINKGILSASVSSGTYLEIEKIKGKIENEKKAVENALDVLGRNLYQHWKEKTLESLDIDQHCMNIESHYANIYSFQLHIKRLEEEKNKILGKDCTLVTETQQIICSKCGNPTPKNGKFCLQCGDELIKEEQENDENIKVCSCGNKCKNTDKFCIKCGSAL